MFWSSPPDHGFDVLDDFVWGDTRYVVTMAGTYVEVQTCEQQGKWVSFCGAHAAYVLAELIHEMLEHTPSEEV